MREGKAFRLLHICVIFVVLMLLVCIALPVYNRYFVTEPSMEAKADNCYEETLRVITDEDYLPYSFYDKNGNISGHDIELIIMIANEMKMNLEIEMAPWSEAVERFSNGEADVLLTCDYFDIHDGLGNIYTSQPVSIEEFVVYSKSDITTVDELYEKNIAVMANGNVFHYLEMLGLFGNCTMYDSNKDALAAVENGMADCAVVRYAVGEAVIKEAKYTDLKSTVSVGLSYICMDVSGDKPELLEKINEAIQVLRDRGDLEIIHNKWLTTFIHDYSFTEIVSNNPWIVIGFAGIFVLALVFYIAIDRERIRNEEINSSRILALEDKLESIYDLELDSGYYDSYIKGQALGSIHNRVANSRKFYEDVEENQKVVYEEDRARFRNTFTPEYLRSRLENAPHFDLYYRLMFEDKTEWFRMRIMYKDSSKKNVLMGVFSAEEEMTAKETAEQIRKEQIAKMIGGESCYIVYPQTGRFVILSQNEHLANNYHEEDFTDSISRYIANDVYGPDKKSAKTGLSLKAMIKALEKNEEYIFRYRDISSGYPRWYELRAVTLSENEILYGFTDRDEEITGDLILEKLENDFFAMFGINLDSENVEILKDAPGKIGKKGNLISFEEFMRKLGDKTQGDVKDFAENSTIEFLKQKLLNEDKNVIVYRSFMNEEKRWGTITTLVLTRQEDGTPASLAMGFSLMDEDAAEKEELKMELQNARDAAERANRSKTNFLFNMSHDIRTPMNVIMGFTSMAKKYLNDQKKVGEYLEKIDTSGEQLLSLINQVLEMARIESGRLDLNEKPVNVFEEYGALMTVFTEQAKVNGLEFNTDIQNIVHDNLLSDRARMSSLVLNIVGNAMKYTPRGGRIDFIYKEIESRKPGYATYLLTVSDTGIGMSEEYLKVLFEPFTREKNSTVSKIQGTGLGMAIVKETIDALGGNIEVFSKLGEGTRFEITIDFKINEKARESTADSEEGYTFEFEGRKALLVEDNELNREIVIDILSDEGLIVESAESGEEALEIMKKKGPEYYDFILMDIQMPGMNGFETTKELRKMYPDMQAPIIALSANAFSEDRDASIAAGMNDHVAKPIKIGELLNVLARYL